MLIGTPNEHAEKLARVRRVVKEFSIVKKPLTAGDYMFDAHNKLVGIEVKWGLGDLLSSFQVVGEAGGPRLAVEVRKMLDVYDIPILVLPTLRRHGSGGIEGAYSDWRYDSAKGILADIQLYGVIVDEWDGHIEDRIAHWYYTLQKEEHGWIKSLGRPDFLTLDLNYREDVWMLSAIQDVGPATAELLLAEFGSVEDVLRIARMEPLTLQNVRGVGPATMGRLHEASKRRYK